MRLIPMLSIVFMGGALALQAAPAHAEFEFSVYGGMNENFDSTIKTRKGAVNDRRNVNWDGKSFVFPTYWGARGTYWCEEKKGWGIALDYTHTKAYADVNFATDPVYDHLEYSDGNNLVIPTLLHRWELTNSKFTPYVGGGIGVAIPHVEVTLDGVAQRTFEYQYGGPAAHILAGTKYELSDHWGAFGEAKLSYSHLDNNLAGGGSVKTELLSPQLALGISYTF